MKLLFTFWAFLFIAISSIFAQSPCGSVIDEYFQDGVLPSGFSEYATTGHVSVSDGHLIMDYSASPKTELDIDFDDFSGNIFVNFSFQTDRNWFNCYVNLLNSDQEVVGQVILGNSDQKGIVISREEIISGNSDDAVNMLTSNIQTNTDYLVSLNIDTESATISGNVDGDVLPDAQGIPLFETTSLNVSSIRIVQDYMFGNESDSDDIRFSSFQVINDPVDRLALSNEIALANDIIDQATVGDQVGQYTQEDVDNFQQEIDEATAVVDNCGATQVEVDAAFEELSAAIESFRLSEIASEVAVSINKSFSHELTEGLAGYNVRITDSPWNYNNEVFREGVKNADIGFLRYYSGTTADYFDMNTGMFEPQWYEQVHSTSDGNKGWNGFPNLIKWQEGKGSSRLSDLYDLLGENEAKLVITWNGFVDGPEEARNLAKFCKDNDIIVECWQFCNEPNFYLPDKRYFFNNGADYVRKMKEIADAILSVDPDANLAMSYGWDGWGGFSSSIKDYQDSKGAFWNKTSVHSYAIHGAGTGFYSAMRIANARLIDKTNNAYFNKVDQNSWPDADLLVTEHGVWNDHLKGTIYSGIYTGEYLARMSVQPQAWLIGKHAMNWAVEPVQSHKSTIWDAWENEYEFDADALPNDYTVKNEALPLLYIHPAINNSVAVYGTSFSGGETVPSSSGDVPALFAASYKGDFDRDYMIIINKSDKLHKPSINLDGEALTGLVKIYSAYSEAADGITFKEDTVEVTADDIILRPHSVKRIEWAKDQNLAPRAPRIYSVEHGGTAVSLKWWNREGAESYEVNYGTSPGAYDQAKTVSANTATIDGLSADKEYYFVVIASNDAGESNESNEVSSFTGVPASPEINYVHEDKRRITIHWESVPFANGYKVKYGTTEGEYTEVVDARNVSGYVLRWVDNDTPYYITVCAYNNAGEGDNAGEIVATAKADRPWAPYLLNGYEKWDGSINLSWSPSVNNHGAEYELYYCPTPWDTDSYSLVESDIQTTSYNDVVSRNAGRHFYRVKASNETGKSFFFSNIATVWKSQSGNTVGIEDVFAKEISVSPNPASSYLKVKLASEMGRVSYRMLNMKGNVLFEGKLSTSKKLDVSSFESGVYFIEFTNENKRAIEKVVIESNN